MKADFPIGAHCRKTHATERFMPVQQGLNACARRIIRATGINANQIRLHSTMERWSCVCTLLANSAVAFRDVIAAGNASLTLALYITMHFDVRYYMDTTCMRYSRKWNKSTSAQSL